MNQSSKDALAELRQRRLEHEANTSTFGELVADLRVIAMDARLDPKNFSDACELVTSFAVSTFSVADSLRADGGAAGLFDDPPPPLEETVLDKGGA